MTIPREHIEFVCPSEVETRPLRLSIADEPVQGKPYSGDAEAGNGAVRLELPQGWRGGGGQADNAFELVVLDGALEVDGKALDQYGYMSVAAGDTIPALSATQETVLFLDYISDVTDTAFIPWDDSGFGVRKQIGPDPAPGLTSKIVRGTSEGARAFFLKIPPGWAEKRTEWHDCSEAAIRLEGSVYSSRANDGKGGTMTRHCYFWRPPRLLHSPMHSDEGAFSFLSVDGLLINHFVEDEGLPPEE